jgi:hypothetical protein
MNKERDSEFHLCITVGILSVCTVLVIFAFLSVVLFTAVGTCRGSGEKVITTPVALEEAEDE